MRGREAERASVAGATHRRVSTGSRECPDWMPVAPHPGLGPQRSPWVGWTGRPWHSRFAASGRWHGGRDRGHRLHRRTPGTALVGGRLPGPLSCARASQARRAAMATSCRSDGASGRPALPGCREGGHGGRRCRLLPGAFDDCAGSSLPTAGPAAGTFVRPRGPYRRRATDHLPRWARRTGRGPQ
jgi:hypothetical protein